MKDKLKIISAFLCGAVFFSGVSFAATGDLIAKTSKFKIVVNGKEQKMTKSPVTIDGSAYVPVRDVGGITGYDVGFKNGVISLTNEQILTNDSKAANEPNVSGTVDTALEFKKLPLSIEKNGISITVNNVSLGESSTNIDLKISNTTNETLDVDYSASMGSNYRVDGLNYGVVGTYYGNNTFTKTIDSGKTVSGVITKSKVSQGTKNLIFHIKVGSESFSFYIDTDGVL